VFGSGYDASTGNQLAFHDSTGSATSKILSQTHLVTNQWYHVAVTDNAGQVRIYINGSLDTSSNSGYGIPKLNSAPINIGKTNPDSTFYFNGAIDDVRVYNRALSAEEIGAVMFNIPASGEPNLVGYWDFDEGSGQKAGDSSGHGNNGTLGNSDANDAADPCWVEPGAPAGQCTTRQMIVRNLTGATDNKKLVNDLLKDAKAKETASSKLVDDLKKDLKGRELFNAMRAKSQITIATIQEDIASRQINVTISWLESAMWLLSEDNNPNQKPKPQYPFSYGPLR
jgi:hypothetical protein